MRNLRARREEIDEAIFARLSGTAAGRTSTEDLAGLDDREYVAGLRAAVKAGVEYLLVGLELGEASTLPPVPEPTLRQARKAAHAGVRLDTVLRRYVAGHAVLEGYLIQEAEKGDLASEHGALRRTFEASASLLDGLIPSIASAYTDEIQSRTAMPARDAAAVTRRPAPGKTSKSNGARPDPRTRIMNALVAVSAEYGFANTKVSVVLARAGVSSRTFYEQFDGLDDCLVAVMSDMLERVMAFVPRELADAEHWQDGVRSALGALLVFFDEEPERTRVCIVDGLAGGSFVLEQRRRMNEAFSSPFIERVERDLKQVPRLTAEGVLSSVHGVLHTHIVAGQPGAFIDLLGPLMGLVMAPYLGARRVEEEIRRGDELARAIRASGRSARSATLNRGTQRGNSAEVVRERVAGIARDDVAGSSSAAHLPAALHLPAAGIGESGGVPDLAGACTPTLHGAPFVPGTPDGRRGRECLVYLAGNPGASNREIGAALGIRHGSQTSKLLADLVGRGLAEKGSEGKGKPNTSRLTERGEEVARALAKEPD